MYICPVCGEPLLEQGTSLRCANRHNFDYAAAGYVHLLLQSGMNSKLPGDNREMVTARRNFLASGGYASLRDGVVHACCEALAEVRAPVVIDAGCGEGYYTGALLQALLEQDAGASVWGFDLSKTALRLAARQEKRAHYAVASLFHLPVPDGCADGVLSIFAPIAGEEFHRVLRPGGRLFLVTPGRRHLFGLKEILYERPYENEELQPDLPGFSLRRELRFAGRITVRAPQIQELFLMTPYYWKTPREGVRRLEDCAELHTEVEFLLHELCRM